MAASFLLTAQAKGNSQCEQTIAIINLTWRKERNLNCTIREYGSTLYVGLARDVSPTNTNFRLTFLLTRL